MNVFKGNMNKSYPLRELTFLYSTIPMKSNILTHAHYYD